VEPGLRSRPHAAVAILLALAASVAVFAITLPLALLLGPLPVSLDARTFTTIALATDVALLLVSLVSIRGAAPVRLAFPAGWWRPTAAAFLGVALANGIGTALIAWTGEEYTGFPRLDTDVWGLVAFVAAVLVAPFCEELFFREALLARILGGTPRTVAILVSSALFGAFHVGSGGAILVATLCVMGAVLADLRLRTGSLGPPLLLHGLNNAIALAYALLAGR